MSRKNPFKKNKNEIMYTIINSALAGGLVFLGALSNGDITAKTIIAGLVASLSVALIHFQDYWKTQQKEYKTCLFTFIK